jgi:hypothetical protein
MTILAALTRLRQVCCDPRLLGLPDASALPPRRSSRRSRSSWPTASARAARSWCSRSSSRCRSCSATRSTELKIDFLWLHGGTKNREEMVAVPVASGPPVFLISLKAGGSGLTLTEADTVVHFDPWWNPAVEDQATDRAHRIGQDKPVMVYRLVVEDTVEQKMVELGARKREVAESALGRDVDGRQEAHHGGRRGAARGAGDSGVGAVTSGDPEVIVIGSGPNGMVAACVLARPG